MFQRWGFLLGEIWVLLALAALLGLLVGWLIWGRRVQVSASAEAEAAKLRADLAACTNRGTEMGLRMGKLEADLARAEAEAKAAAEEAKKRIWAAEDAAARARQAGVAAPLAAAPAMAAPAAALISAEAAAPAAKPQGLSAARGGKADDLKLIKGVGPVLEKLLHSLGYFHFDQIAAWTRAEIAWVDDNLEGFKGRVSRDEWVIQARDLAAGKPPRAGGEK